MLITNCKQINDRTLSSIATYLSSSMSDNLRVLQMDQCNLSGSHVASIMRSMIRAAGTARNLQLSVSANRLERGMHDVIEAIRNNNTPSSLVIRMIEFTKEDHFRQLLQALRTNTTIRSLDISKASLPYDAGPETCDALRLVFAENKTLEELDISGEQAHLEVTRFGIGLNHALTGLKGNTTLRILRIEYQNLGLEGANTLSSVLEENKGLTHIYCEHNDINLQGFTILVNSLAKNYTILELPFMVDDQDVAMRRISICMRDSRNLATSQRDHYVKTTVRKTLTNLGVSMSKPQKPELTPQDFETVVQVLGERWGTEMKRMAIFLDRNRNIVAGTDGYGPDADGVLPDEAMRPTTAMSDRGILERILSNITPKSELTNPLDDHITSKVTGLSINELAGNGTENEKGVELADNGLTGETIKSAKTIKNHVGDLNLETGNSKLPELPMIMRDNMFGLDGRMFKMET